MIWNKNLMVIIFNFRKAVVDRTTTRIGEIRYLRMEINLFLTVAVKKHTPTVEKISIYKIFMSW